MIVYNNCTTKARTNNVKLFDLLVWIASIIQYKNLGYTTKLFCSRQDIPFLKQNHLWELYDIVDIHTIDNSKNLNIIDNHKFWSSIKLEVINKQLQLDPTSIYSDTDVIMFNKFDTSADFIFWTEEPAGSVYLPWDKLTKPKNYILPEAVYDTNNGYNCGIMKFKSYDIFKEFYDNYYNFVIGNPCLLDFFDYENNVYACNAEQRILKGTLSKYKDNISLVCDWDTNGLSHNGLHIFIYKVLWNEMKYLKMEPEYKLNLINILNLVKDKCFEIIEKCNYWNISCYLKSFDYFKTEKLTEYK